MKWGRSEYHNSRSYAVDDAPIGQFELMLAWIVLKAKTILKAGKRPTSSTVLMADGRRHFSLIGAKRERRVLPDDCPFPTRPPATANDWRVLP